MSTKTKTDPMLQRHGYRVQITDAGGNPVALTWEMTLNDALSVSQEWYTTDGGEVSIIIPEKPGGNGKKR